MPLLTWIILFCLLGGLLSVLAAAVFLILSESLRNQLLPHLVSFATGALLGAALLGLLPHALESVADTDTHVIPMVVLMGCWVFSYSRSWCFGVIVMRITVKCMRRISPIRIARPVP